MKAYVINPSRDGQTEILFGHPAEQAEDQGAGRFAMTVTTGRRYLVVTDFAEAVLAAMVWRC